tara:strand:- start:404 stop:580 length:177 start_codon:yes stop_codon:yes gene_type:complete
MVIRLKIFCIILLLNIPTPLKSNAEVSNLHYILTCHNKEDNLIINFAVQPEKKKYKFV